VTQKVTRKFASNACILFMCGVIIAPRHKPLGLFFWGRKMYLEIVTGGEAMSQVIESQKFLVDMAWRRYLSGEAPYNTDPNVRALRTETRIIGNRSSLCAQLLWGM
jgi:hypothetical protein